MRDVLAGRPAAGDALWRLEFEAWLGALGAAERELAHLRFVEGLSHEELAAAFDVPRGTAQQTRPLDTDEVQFKLDHALTGAHQLTGSYFHQRGKDVERMRGNLAWVDREFTWKQHNLNLSDTWTLSPTMINQFRVTYVRLFGGRLNTPQKSLGDFGSRFNVQGPPTLPQIQVAGRFNLNVAIGGPVGGSNLYQVRDVFSWTRGSHSLKFGGEASLEKLIQDTTLNNYGIFNFNSNNARGTGNAMADFLLGLPVTFNQDAPITKIDNGWYMGPSASSCNCAPRRPTRSTSST